MENFHLILGFCIFMIGCLGAVINRMNFVRFIISIEIILVSATYIFAYSSYIFGKFNGVAMALLIIPVAATEIAICIAVINQKRENP